MPVTDYDPTVQANAVHIIGHGWDLDIAANTAVDTTARIKREGFAFGSVQVPTGSSITSITWYGTNRVAQVGGATKDDTATAVSAQTSLSAGDIVQIPSAIIGCKYILPVTDAAGTLYVHMER